MTSFKNFWNNSNVSNDSYKLCTCLSTGIQKLTLTSNVLFSNSQTEKFSHEVTQFITSDEVITSLSREIGNPKQNETEDEFVTRASNILKKILEEKFNL